MGVDFMAGKSKYLVLLIGLIAIFFSLTAERNLAPQSNSVYLVSPASCPPSGCVAGQRLNMRTDFTLGTFDASASSDGNTQVCVYAPTNWSPILLEPGKIGGVSGAAYASDSPNCDDAPHDYFLAGGAHADLPTSLFGDSLGFAFRFPGAAKTSGSILVRVREWIAGSWTTTSEAFSFVPVTARTSQVYVANDATACGTNTPCFVNSMDDLPNGIGTGLKDAVDSSTAQITINVLGNYNIKSNTVLIDKPHIISGLNNASLVYQGLDCSQTMLKITAGATLSDLTISDGGCATTSRNLIRIESTSAADQITLESNDLVNGQDAIQIGPANAADILVRYNQISQNSGYGIIIDSSNPNAGILDAVANNIFSNRSGAQVDCGNVGGTTPVLKGTVDHNFWGAATTANAISKCTFTDGKRLGAAVMHNAGAPGLDTQRVTVSSTLTYAFGDQVGFQLLRAITVTGFDLYIVNHGYGSSDNIPFTGAQSANPTACGNFWDIFMADSAVTPDSTSVLDLHFKYNLSANCVSTINTTRFCNQTSDPSQYPLFWYEAAANTWATTGRAPGGQPTRCDTSKSEVIVSIDAADGRPNFNDLSRVPFVAGLPGQSAAVVFSSFTAAPGDKKDVLNWTTASETSIAGFIVTRSTKADSGFVDVSDLIPSQGTNGNGAVYQYIDQLNLVNNTTYYYRLKIVNQDLSTTFSGTVSVMPFPSTPTPTPTRTITPTRTNTRIPPTPTRTRTLFPTTIFYYLSPTPTGTRTITPTSPFKSITPTGSVTPTLGGTSLAPEGTKTSAYPAVTASLTVPAATELVEARQTRTALALGSITPTPAAGAGPINISLTGALAILALLAAIAGGVIYFLRNRLRLPA